MFITANYLPNFHYDFAFTLPTVITLLVVASIIGCLALYDFRKHQTTFHPHTPEKTRKVVDSGIYAFSRNPMYIALVFVLLAFGVYLQNFSCFAVLPLFICYITQFQIIPEERMLDKLFPNDYQAYCQRVRRWL